MDNSTSVGFCETDFWDINVTWYAEIPDFTPCFQNVIFVLTPFMIFWPVAVINLWRTSKLDSLPLTWTLLRITELVFTVILMIISATEAVFDSYSIYAGRSNAYAEFSASCCKMITFIFIIVMLIQHRKHGVLTSSTLSIFWFFATLCGVVMYRSSFLGLFCKVTECEEKFIFDMCYYPFIFLQFILSLFADSREHDPLDEDVALLDKVPFFSFLTLHWFNSIIVKSYKKLLTVEDLPPLVSQLRSRNVWFKFEEVWYKSLRKMTKQNGKYNLVPSDSPMGKLTIPSLTLILIKAFWPWLLIAGLLRLVLDLTSFFPSLILDLLIGFAGNDERMWRGYLYCVLLFCSAVMSKIVYQHVLLHSMSAALQIKSALLLAVYRKALRLSSDARKNYTVGELVNLMGVDIDKVHEFFQFYTSAYGSPLKAFIMIILLWQYLGPSCLAGVAAVLIVIIISMFVYKKQHEIQKKQMETKDLRLKHMNELLNGIKVLKLCAWEIPFMKKIEDIRMKEVRLIRAFQYCYAMVAFSWSCSPFFVALASFVTYVLVNEANILDPSTAFVSLSLLNMMRHSLFELPMVLSQLIRANISLKRLRIFLSSEERDPLAVGYTPDEGNRISFRNASFSWEAEANPFLKNIELQIPTGSLVAVVGSVGSGKSSLLSSMLGDMYKLGGSVDLEGSIAYVPQQGWILNQTFRRNIIFTKCLEKQKYSSVLSNCCLEPDLELLPGGDMTEIGEKGVNLSGGQKQRVSLARAVYQNADVYLLDDPLSAVDAHVGKDLFDNVIGPKGMLRDKTRILVTHSIAVLPEVDFIVSMKDGEIEEMGTYKELMIRDGPFASFLREHQQLSPESEGSDVVSPTVADIDPFGHVQAIGLSQMSLSGQSTASTARIESADFKQKRILRLVEDEAMKVGTVKTHVYLYYFRHAGLRFFFGLVAADLLCLSLEAGSNVWLSEWSKDPVLPDGTQDIPLRNRRIGVYATLGLSEAVSVLVGCFMLALGAARASKLFHHKMLESVMKSPMSFFETTPLGRIINRFGKDMDIVDANIIMSTDGWMTSIVQIVVTCVVIGIGIPVFLPFLIPIGCVYYLVQKLYMITSRQIKRLDSTTRSPVYSHFSESMQGASSIRAYGAVNDFLRNLQQKIDTNVACGFYGVCANRWLGTRLEVLGNIIVLITALLAVARRGSMDAAVVGLTITYSLSITDALLWAVRSGTDLENHLVSVERIEEYTDLTPEAPWMRKDNQPPPQWPPNGNVSFQNYSTRYRENLDLVLKGINLDISRGEKVGIVGRTGAGKSSITMALFRIIEAVEGRVIIDDVDVSELGLHDLRSKLTIIPQDPVLFTGTLRINVDPNEEYSDEELWTSLEHAHLKDFVASLPEGLNYEILEGGENMSVGQRQLVCLARALLKKTKILVLDEATAAVDMETDRLIQSTIRQEFENYTVITIAHRLHTIMDYDKVVVMDAGQVVEVGKPSDLLQTPGSLFYSLAKNARLV